MKRQLGETVPARFKALGRLASLLVVLTAGAASAQQPSEDQISAVRQSCRSDFMANCSGVTPGGKDAIACLSRNLAKLSGACKTAVTAIAPAPAASPMPAAAPPSPAVPKPGVAQAPKPAPKAVTAAPAPAPAAAAAAPAGFPPLGAVRPMLPQRALVIRAICHADQQAFCAGVSPIGPAVLSCLAENGPHLSPECYKALVPVTVNR